MLQKKFILKYAKKRSLLWENTYKTLKRRC
jgi:hypothetical protein